MEICLETHKYNEEDTCLVDSATTHSIFNKDKYFSKLKLEESCVNTISGSAKLIEGSGRACILLPGGTKLIIEDALFSTKSQRNLLSFKDIRLNGYHIETMGYKGREYLNITSDNSGVKRVLEWLPALSSGLYYTKIKTIESYAVVNQSFTTEFNTWHDRLGHPGAVMMRRIIENSQGHSLRNKKILQANELSCAACSQGKLIIRPSPAKVGYENPTFLERIQGDICGPVHPPSGPFKYFMVLIEASTKWSHVCLLSSRNQAFAKLLGQIIRLRAQFPDYAIKKIRLDNAGEFTSHAFNDYCLSIGINIEHPVAHVHTQNGLAESLIKRIQLIARPMLMKSKLPVSAWGHAVLHAAALIRIRPTSYNNTSPYQMVQGQEPNISHLRIFGCAVYVPIAPPQRTKMGPQRRLGIYVGYESPSIIRYLEPLTGDLFTARFADCHFDESIFPTLGGENKKLDNNISWKELSLNSLDPRTNQCELEVQKIIHLQRIANQLPDAFADLNRVTRSYIPAANAPMRIDVPMGQTSITNESKARQRRGRPIGSKDKNPRKKKCSILDNEHKEDIGAPEEHPRIIDHDIQTAVEVPKELPIPQNNEEISINYVTNRKTWNRNEIKIDDIFAYNIAIDVMEENEDPEPTSVDECRERNQNGKTQ